MDALKIPLQGKNIMPMITVNGVEFYYELHGEGTPLVLIAGYACDHNVWNFMLKDLAQKFQLLTFDNRAIGQTKDNGAPFTLETMADDTMALIKQLGIKKPHILGQSMGGGIAQSLARKYPSEIERLIILNSMSHCSIRTKLILDGFLSALKSNVDINSLIDLSMPWFFGTQFLKNQALRFGFKQLLLNNAYPQTVSDQERQLQALVAFNSLNWLAEITAPSLIISATEDIISLPEESKLLANGISKAQFQLVPGGHSSPLEAYEQVNALIFQFLT